MECPALRFLLPPSVSPCRRESPFRPLSPCCLLTCATLRLPALGYTVDSFAPARFALRANLRLVYLAPALALDCLSLWTCAIARVFAPARQTPLRPVAKPKRLSMVARECQKMNANRKPRRVGVPPTSFYAGGRGRPPSLRPSSHRPRNFFKIPPLSDLRHSRASSVIRGHLPLSGPRSLPTRLLSAKNSQ